MGDRRKSRELAIQVLFSLEFILKDPDEVFEQVCNNFYAPKSIQTFAKQIVLGVYNNKETLDLMIRDNSHNWRLERISHMDISILRLATYEILFEETIPSKVSIYEAVELGKRFSSEKSGSYLNGVLDKIYKEYLQKKKS